MKNKKYISNRVHSTKLFVCIS